MRIPHYSINNHKMQYSRPRFLCKRVSAVPDSLNDNIGSKEAMGKQGKAPAISEGKRRICKHLTHSTSLLHNPNQIVIILSVLTA